MFVQPHRRFAAEVLVSPRLPSPLGGSHLQVIRKTLVLVQARLDDGCALMQDRWCYNILTQVIQYHVWGSKHSEVALLTRQLLNLEGDIGLTTPFGRAAASAFCRFIG